MANGSRKDMENQGNAGMGLLGLLGVALVGGVAAGVSSSSKRKKLQEELDDVRSRISRIEYQIDSLKSQFLGSFTNASEISELEAQRANLIRRNNELVAELNG